MHIRMRIQSLPFLGQLDLKLQQVPKFLMDMTHLPVKSISPAIGVPCKIKHIARLCHVVWQYNKTHQTGFRK